MNINNLSTAFTTNKVKESRDFYVKHFGAIVTLEDHPWGDKGFAIQDPNGVSLYIYSDREPSEEFKQYHKKA